MIRDMCGFIAAVKFLTCIPIKSKPDPEFSHALMYFPCVGLFIGIILVLVYQLFRFMPQPVVSLLIVITLLIISGVLHLDGFADTLEGFYAGRTKDEILAIMRDMNRGTIGMIGLVAIILSKFILLNELGQNIILPALITLPVLSRFLLVLSIFTSDYARDDGKAKIFFQNKKVIDFYVAAAVCLSIMLLALGLKGIIVFLFVCSVIFFINKFIQRKIDGITGDTLGAVNEISEILTVFIIIILWI